MSSAFHRLPEPPVLSPARLSGRALAWTFAGVAAVLATRAIVRTLISDSLEWDEAEQLVQVQAWRWGYGPQPPLYTWLQKVVCALVGRNIFALVLLKNALLFASFWVTYLVGREISGDRGVGLVAALSLFFLPVFVWSAQNDLTHSVLVMLAGAVSFLVVCRLMRRPATITYLALGVTMAVGVLSKYNYLLLLAALLPALLCAPAGRRALADRRILLSLGLCLLLLAAHLNWLWWHGEVIEQKLPDLQASGQPGIAADWVYGLLTLSVALLAYLLPLWLAWAIIFRRPPAFVRLWNRADQEPVAPLLKHVLLFSLVIYILSILLFQAKFKDRWIQPNLYALTLLVALTMRPQLSGRSLARCAALAAIVAGTVLLAGNALLFGVALTGQARRLNMPYHELAELLKESAGHPGTIIAESAPLGAGLGLRFSDAALVVPRQLPPQERPGPVLLVVEASGEPAERLASLLEQLGPHGVNLQEPRYVEAPLRYCTSRRLRLAYAFISQGESVPDAAAPVSLNSR